MNPPEPKITRAEQRKILFKKKKGLFKAYEDTSDFKEPIIIFMRRNQKAEFFENATQGEWEYEHSDGTIRKILLNTKYLQSFPYGKKVFKGYICHEDHPLPLPAEPEITAETVGLAIDKTLNDIKKWKAEEYRAKAQYWKQIGIIILGMIGLYILYRIIIPVPDTTPEQAIMQVGNTTVQVLNRTPTVLG